MPETKKIFQSDLISRGIRFHFHLLCIGALSRQVAKSLVFRCISLALMKITWLDRRFIAALDCFTWLWGFEQTVGDYVQPTAATLVKKGVLPGWLPFPVCTVYFVLFQFAHDFIASSCATSKQLSGDVNQTKTSIEFQQVLKKLSKRWETQLAETIILLQVTLCSYRVKADVNTVGFAASLKLLQRASGLTWSRLEMLLESYCLCSRHQTDLKLNLNPNTLSVLFWTYLQARDFVATHTYNDCNAYSIAMERLLCKYGRGDRVSLTSTLPQGGFEVEAFYLGMIHSTKIFQSLCSKVSDTSDAWFCRHLIFRETLRTAKFETLFYVGLGYIDCSKYLHHDDKCAVYGFDLERVLELRSKFRIHAPRVKLNACDLNRPDAFVDLIDKSTERNQVYFIAFEYVLDYVDSYAYSTLFSGLAKISAKKGLKVFVMFDAVDKTSEIRSIVAASGFGTIFCRSAKDLRSRYITDLNERRKTWGLMEPYSCCLLEVGE